MSDEILLKELQLLRADLKIYNKRAARRFSAQRARVRHIENCLHLIEKSTAPLLALWRDWVAAKAFLQRIRPVLVWLLKFIVVPIIGLVAFSMAFELEGVDWLVSFLVELLE